MSQALPLSESIRQRFSISPPLLLGISKEAVKLELKPYLQPFERDLAMRELRALLGDKCAISEEMGYFVAYTSIPDEFLRSRLTYWQRLGRAFLEPTAQTAFEFTQSGMASVAEKQELHNARRLRYGPHDIHEYRGKFFPQLVRSLLNIAGTPDRGLVLDPMCGSGTTPCEAVSSGRTAIGADLNPLSVLIASVKSALVLENREVFLKTVSSFNTKLMRRNTSPEKTWSKEDLIYLMRWFDPEAIQDLASILANIKTVKKPFYRAFFNVCLSNIIRSVSWQKADDLRVRKEVKYYEPGDAFSLFKRQLDDQLNKIYPYLCLLQEPNELQKINIRQGNSVNISDLFSEYRGMVDALITSPPYATALPYLDTDRLSLVVLGLLPWTDHRATEALMIGTREVSERRRKEAWEIFSSRKSELPLVVSKLIEEIANHNHGDQIGFRRRNLPALLGLYFLSMLDAMRSARKLMRKNAPGYYVVGNNSTTVNGEKIEIPTDKFLFEIGAVAGWKPNEMISMELLASRDIFRDNRGSAETILCFSA